MENIEIKKITLKSENYPSKLKEIRSAPKELFYLGNLEILKNKSALAIVGTRKATSYGKKVLRAIIPDICLRNIVIVSGLAYGIDVLAHELALENKGKAVVVLAGGLDQIYPPEHKLFAQKIIKSGGLLISEHAPGVEYLRQHFPARNRIISGLSDATLVVEAKKKSGALITANFAFSQKRQLFAAPGDVFSPQSQGVNGLFEKGALPVQDSGDIFKFFFPHSKNSRKTEVDKKTEPTELNLSEEEKVVFDIVSTGHSIPINTLIRKSKFPPSKAVAILTQIELKGLIEMVEGQGYIRL